MVLKSKSFNVMVYQDNPKLAVENGISNALVIRLRLLKAAA
jgi:hypothetical protein